MLAGKSWNVWNGGTVVLLQLSDCTEQQVSCNEAQQVSAAFSEQLSVRVREEGDKTAELMT